MALVVNIFKLVVVVILDYLLVNNYYQLVDARK